MNLGFSQMVCLKICLLIFGIVKGKQNYGVVRVHFKRLDTPAVSAGFGCDVISAVANSRRSLLESSQDDTDCTDYRLVCD